jgi:hypothetical protein
MVGMETGWREASAPGPVESEHLHALGVEVIHENAEHVVLAHFVRRETRGEANGSEPFAIRIEDVAFRGPVSFNATVVLRSPYEAVRVHE